jgi:hypothetical protein
MPPARVGQTLDEYAVALLEEIRDLIRGRLPADL